MPRVSATPSTGQSRVASPSPAHRRGASPRPPSRAATEAAAERSHGAAERLRFIDRELFWEARINRADLIAAFKISPAQAALDFKAYLDLSGGERGGVGYDTRAKCYVALERFRPHFGTPDARATLESLGTGGDTMTAQLPRLARPIDAATAARVRRAARDGERLDILYQSFTRPEAARRSIAPARLVSDGERWHVRAWCFRESAWRDFVLARILDVGRTSARAGRLPPDIEWNTTIELVLAPARHLSKGQRQSVAREFDMTNGRLVVTMPKALRIYAIRHWGLDRADSRLTILSEI